MRRLILISALLLASASAQAGQGRGLVLAAADTPAVTTADALPQPLPPVAKNDAKTDAKNDAPRQQASVPSAPAPSVPKQRSRARRYQSDEAKARRIAAKYGISW